MAFVLSITTNGPLLCDVLIGQGKSMTKRGMTWADTVREPGRVDKMRTDRLQGCHFLLIPDEVCLNPVVYDGIYRFRELKG
jgi:hypothetical protein